MLLLIGIQSEPPVRLVIQAAESLGIPFVLFNQRESSFIDIYLEISDKKVNGCLYIRESEWHLSDFSGVYVRMMDPRDLPENQLYANVPEYQERVKKVTLLHESLNEWLEIASCRIMNRNSAMGSNMSKPYQSKFISQVGFRTPPTLITNIPEMVRSFRKEHNKVIFKSISSIRSIVKELDDKKLKDLSDVSHLPTQFQAKLLGTNIRVHIVGDKIFATEILTSAVDYRYAAYDNLDVQMIPVELPEEIETRCFRLSRILDLPLCGIDLIRTLEGEYYCLEANPSPGFSYYQETTGQDIASAIVRYLAGV